MALIDKPSNDKTLALDDSPKNEDDFKSGGLISFIEKRYTKSEESRRTDEDRWLKAYRNYRGIYGPDVQLTETEKSRVFIKVTKTKVLAAYGQIIDVLFSNNKFPLSIDPSVLPEGVVDTVHFDTNPAVPPSFNPETAEDFDLDRIEEKLGAMSKDLKDIPNLKEGPGVTPTAVTFEPAMVAAKKMEKKIHDQLNESNANKRF